MKKISTRCKLVYIRYYIRNIKVKSEDQRFTVQ
jgi:hypothetical protein